MQGGQDHIILLKNNNWEERKQDKKVLFLGHWVSEDQVSYTHIGEKMQPYQH